MEISSPELVILDKTHPRSLVNLLPDPVVRALDGHLNNHLKKALFFKTENELFSALRSGEKTPTATDNRIRIKFWIEYDRVQSTNEPRLVMTNIIGNTISRELFYGHYIVRAERLAWMLCPPIDYAARGEEALCFAINRLREILEVPIKNRQGQIIPGAAKVILDITKFLDERLYGAYPTRAVTKRESAEWGSQNGKVKKGLAVAAALVVEEETKDLVNQNIEAMSIEQAHRKLKELEAEERKMGLYTAPGPVPVGENE